MTLTKLDAVNIFNKMLSGEDVCMNFQIEKTCTEVCNFLIKTFQGIDGDIYLAANDQMEDGEYKDSLIELMRLLNEKGGRVFSLNKYKYSIRDAQNDIMSYGEEKCKEVGLGEPYVAVQFSAKNRNNFLMDIGNVGSFKAICNKATNTKKNQSYEELKELVKQAYEEKLDKVTDVFGLYSSHYVPIHVPNYEFATEATYRSCIDEINKILNGGYTVDMEPSDKQLYWINKKLGVDGASLNRYQASELLDVLFKGYDNAAKSNPQDVINFYKRKLRVTESTLKKKIHKIIMEEINKLRLPM